MMQLSSMLSSFRFSDDAALLNDIKSIEEFGHFCSNAVAVQAEGTIRTRLLASAVRVDLRLIPTVAESLADLRKRVGVEAPIEAYVFEESGVNAFVTKGRSQTLVALSSGSVNHLSKSELEFVIGHELGHAVFGHLEVAASQALHSGRLSPHACMQIRAWQRAAEISADRVGLMCCGSLDTAANALFKTLSGLNLAGHSIDPAEFSEQWDHLEREVLEGGETDHWQLTHPFPPLRMKAMKTFWDSISGDPEKSEWTEEMNNATDVHVSRLLNMMDPIARERKDSSDPILSDFFLWGGLYLALANNELHESELQRLATMTSQARLDDAVRAGVPDSEQCMAMFVQCIERRRQKLRALEIHRILQGILQIAEADGVIDDEEIAALYLLAEKLGIEASACSLMISRFKEGR